MKAHFTKHILRFKRPAGTSRGILKTKDAYFIILEKNGEKGIGECGLLRGLSADDRPDYENKLGWLCANISQPFENLYDELKEWPSIQFGLEQAFLDFESENHVLFPSKFTEGKARQPINGLIWVGDSNFMKRQVREKIRAGFSVLKMKIGALDFDSEMRILRNIRKEFSKEELELRVDANGAFSFENAGEVLQQLADLEIHSIEQPIAKNQWPEMARLCENPPIPIALDEELIGLFDSAERRKMLETIRPQYVILKPSFIGGFCGTKEWIKRAEEMKIGYWLTSALESNIGLNAIAQFNFTLQNPIASGLGTGSLYENNFDSPLYIKSGQIGFDPDGEWEIPYF